MVYSARSPMPFSRALGIIVQTGLKGLEVDYLVGVEDYKGDQRCKAVVLPSMVGGLYCKVKRCDMDAKVHAENYLIVDWGDIDVEEDKALDLGMVVDTEVESVVDVCNSLELSLGHAGNLEER